MAGAHIAFLTPTISREGGGLLDCVRRLGQQLHCLENRVNVLSLRDHYSEEDLPQWAPLTVNLFPRRGPRTFAYGDGLAEALGWAEPDIVHTFGLWTHLSIVASSWSRRSKCPIVVSPQGMLDQWALKKSRLKKQLAAFVYEKRHLLKASCLHAVSMNEAAEMRSYGLSNPICVIPNGVDLPGTSGLSFDRATPWEHLVPRGKKILLFLGRIHFKKGLVPLMDGLATLYHQRDGKKQIEEWHLVIAGWDQDNHLNELQRRVDEAKLSRNVSFVGPLFGDRKTAAYRNADAFILPSFGEGQPLAVLEAWSYGLPVLMTPECNLAEGFTEAAIRIQADQQEISKGLHKLFSLSGLQRREMGSRGRQLVKMKFNWRTIAERMRDVYEWLSGQGPQPDDIIV